MNCAECQTDPLTPGHYCPCCGRKLSLEEQRAAGGTVPACAPVLASPIVAAPSQESAPVVAQLVPALETTPEVSGPPPVVNVDEVKRAKAKEAADLIAQAHLAKAANPAPVVRRPVVAIPPPMQRQSRTPMLLMIAAAVIVGAIGAAEGARRLGFEWPGQEVRVAPPVSRDTPSVPKIVAENNVVTRPAARPKTDTAAERRAPVVARNSSSAIPASAPARPAVSASAPPTATLTGRFFESNDVDQPPRVASRVAPRLPANLPAGADKKIAVARVLVSSTGHPYHVSLLRGSTLGRASDEAVVAAVTQWTFSPATKRGEPVNCWYNIGVPLGHAD